MKITSYCPICATHVPTKQFGFIDAFVAKRVMGWEPIATTIGEQTVPLNVRCGILVCPECDFICSDVRFSNGEMKNIYHDYRQPSYNEERCKYEPWYIDVANKIETDDIEIRKPIMAAFFERNNIHPNSFLDYGSGNGNLMPAKFNPTFYDPYYMNERPEGKFDLISCSHVLEHVTEPLKLMADIKTFASDDCIYYLEVPLEEKEESTIFNGRHFHEHINVFRKKSFARLLKNSGLEVIVMEDFPIDLSTGHNIFLRCLAK